MFIEKSITAFNHKSVNKRTIAAMHEQMSRLYQAVERLTGVKGQSAVARAMNESPQVLKNWESRGISSNGLIKAQELFGINPNWLKTGDGVPDYATMLLRENFKRQGVEESDEYLAGVGRMPEQAREAMQWGQSQRGVVPQAAMADPEPATTTGTRTYEIPVLLTEASMGAGQDIEDLETVVTSLSLTSDWFREYLPSVKPKDVRVISGRGNSMSPTFNDGDLLLVDTSMRVVDIDGVYALRAHGRLFVKTVRQRLDGTFEISSDNPSVKTVDILKGDHEVDVLGRVGWAWNGKRL